MRRQRRSGVFLVNFEYISYLFLVFLIVDFEQLNVSWKALISSRMFQLFRSKTTHSNDQVLRRQSNACNAQRCSGVSLETSRSIWAKLTTCSSS